MDLTMLKALRYGLYAQLLLGLGRMFGLVPSATLWMFHVIIGIGVGILALVALQPLPQMTGDVMRTIARFAPLATLIVGFMWMGNVVPGRGFIMFHMLLGIITVGLVEMSAGRQRRLFRDDAPTG